MPTEAEGVDIARVIELQSMLLFRGWWYKLMKLHFTGKTITEAINTRPLEVHKDKWDCQSTIGKIQNSKYHMTTLLIR